MSAQQVSANALEKLLPVLVHIQANLDGDLSLEALAKRVRLSQFHFHRLFRSAVGETLKQYTQRLRLERAANRLILLDATVLDVALDSGFQNHETFSREFKRRFLVTPRGYRKWGRGKLQKGLVSTSPLDERYDDFELSDTKVTRMAELHVAFVRHVGPYEDVPDTLWGRLADWARERRLPLDLIFLGIAQDAPGVTPAGKLRFDAGIVVSEPFSAEGAIGHQVIGAAEFAMTSHVGHYRTLPEAYGAIVQRVGKLKGYRIGGLPSIEVYRTTRVDANHEMNHTEIYIPVTRVER
ncbi:MAG TPA: AraC family transcriptional regulator [Blastocatellia bacterium]|nr:AraC family transcriptional regulator [Blastocatellia bacterium]